VIRIRRTSDSQLLHNIAKGLGIGNLSENYAVWSMAAHADVQRLVQDYLEQPVGQIISKKFIDVIKFRYILSVISEQYRIAKDKQLIKDNIEFLGSYVVKHSVLFIQDVHTGFQIKLAYPVYYSEIGCVIFGNLETGQV